MTFEVRLPSGAVFSTSTLEVGGDSIQVEFESPTASQLRTYPKNLGLAVVTLALPLNIEGASIAVKCANGSASIPFPASWSSQKRPFTLVLE